MSKADCRNEKLDEKLPRLLEGRFMKEKHTGKRIHIDKYKGSTASGHFEVKCHLVGGDDPWSLDSRRTSRTCTRTSESCDAPDIEPVLQSGMEASEEAVVDVGGNRSLESFLFKKHEQVEASKQILGEQADDILEQYAGGGSRRGSMVSQQNGAASCRNSLLSNEDAGNCHRSSIASRESGGIHREFSLSQERGGSNHNNSISNQGNFGSIRRSSVMSQEDRDDGCHKPSLSRASGGTSSRRLSFQEDQIRRSSDRQMSEISEPEVAAGTPSGESRKVSFDNAGFDGEEPQACRRSSKRKPTPSPKSLHGESQNFSDFESPRPSIGGRESGSAGKGSITQSRLSCGQESSISLGNTGTEKDVSISQVEQALVAQESKVVRSAVSYISSDDGDYCNDEVRTANKEGRPPSRRSSQKRLSQISRNSQQSGKMSMNHEDGLSIRGTYGESQRFSRESNGTVSHAASQRPSRLQEQCGAERESNAGRQSAVSQVSAEVCNSDGMASVMMRGDQPRVLDRMSQNSAGMASVMMKGGEPCVIDRTSNGQWFAEENMDLIRNSQGRASSRLERASSGHQRASQRSSYSQQHPTILERSNETAGSSSKLSAGVFEVKSTVQDIAEFEFEDTDGHVICLMREDGCINMYVDGVLEATDLQYFSINEQEHEYAFAHGRGRLQLDQDVKKLGELRDALFECEGKRSFREMCDAPVGDEAGVQDASIEQIPRKLKITGRESPRESLRASRRGPFSTSQDAVQVDRETPSLQIAESPQSKQSATCGECSVECSRQLESEHKSISDDEGVERRYSRADCRFTRRGTSTYVGLTQLPTLQGPLVCQPQTHAISGTERSRVKLLLEKADAALKDHDSRFAFADFPELLKGLGETVTVYTRSISDAGDSCGISTLEGLPVALLTFAKLVEVLDRIIPSEAVRANCKDTTDVVPATVVWSGEMLNALRQGLSSTGFLPTCCDLLAGRYKQIFEEMNSCELAGELELHALLAVRLALTWIPPPHIQGPCDTFCAIEGHKTLMMVAADLLNLIREKRAGYSRPKIPIPPTTAKEGHDCVGQLALVLESLLCGVRCDSSFMKFAYGQDQANTSGNTRSVYGSTVVPLAPMALNALEVVSVLHAPGLERDKGAAVDAAATASLNLLAQLAEGPINTTVVPANSISTAVCYLLASKPLTVRLAAALRALICRPSHQPGWFVGKRKARLDTELRAAFNAADLSIDLIHCTQKALTMGKDQSRGKADSWEEEAAVLKECTSKVCDLYGHVQAIINELNHNKPEELAELRKSLPRCECCGESPLESTNCSSDSQTASQRSVLGKLNCLHSQIRQSWCLAPYLTY